MDLSLSACICARSRPPFPARATRNGRRRLVPSLPPPLPLEQVLLLHVISSRAAEEPVITYHNSCFSAAATAG